MDEFISGRCIANTNEVPNTITMSFPLYTNIVTKTKGKKKDLSVKAKAEFIKKMNRMDAVGFELVYALIKTHEKSVSQDDSFNTSIIPYNGVMKENDISFDIDDLPIALRHIIMTFIDMHLEKMSEELEFEKKRDDFSSPSIKPKK